MLKSAAKFRSWLIKSNQAISPLLVLLFWLLSPGASWAEISTTVTYYHTDILGSVIATSDENGNILWRRVYQPYGETHQPDPGDTEDIGYTGKQRDETGLIYFGARYYDPIAGRFMGIDPVGFRIESPHSFNRYAYANNNPYRFVDPDGQWGILAKAAKIIWKGGDIAGTFAGAAEDVGTIFSGSASMGQRGLALVSLASEIVSPVSLREGKAIRNFVKGCCCFPAETPVLTDNGLQAIETLTVGDLVYARDTKTGETALKPITRRIVSENRQLYELALANAQGETGLTKVTDDHPYWVPAQGWVDSIDLQPGMQVENLDDELLTVVSIRVLDEIDTTYNFTVADFHTYFVGSQRVLVHNCDCVSEKKVNSAGQLIDEKGRFLSGAGGESAVAAKGRAAHDAFDAKVRAKADQGWVSQPRIVDADGTVHIPDALTPSGRPIEYKPNTPSGIKAGRRQLKRYERVTGKKGRLLTYD